MTDEKEIRKLLHSIYRGPWWWRLLHPIKANRIDKSIVAATEATIADNTQLPKPEQEPEDDIPTLYWEG